MRSSVDSYQRRDAGWFTFGSARKPNGQFGRSSFSGLRLEEPPNEYVNEKK